MFESLTFIGLAVLFAIVVLGMLMVVIWRLDRSDDGRGGTIGINNYEINSSLLIPRELTLLHALQEHYGVDYEIMARFKIKNLTYESEELDIQTLKPNQEIKTMEEQYINSISHHLVRINQPTILKDCYHKPLNKEFINSYKNSKLRKKSKEMENYKMNKIEEESSQKDNSDSLLEESVDSILSD